MFKTVAIILASFQYQRKMSIFLLSEVFSLKPTQLKIGPCVNVKHRSGFLVFTKNTIFLSFLQQFCCLGNRNKPDKDKPKSYADS